MKTIDDGGEHSGVEIVGLLAGDPALTIGNVKVVDDLDIPYEMRVDELVVAGVHFVGRVELSGEKGKLSFRNCVFEKEVSFYLARPAEIAFEECDARSRVNFHSVKTSSFWLNRSRFRDHCVFVNMEVGGLVNLADVVFEASADFAGARIGEMNLTRLRTKEPMQITWRQFGRTWLNGFRSWALAPEGEERQSRLRQLETHLQFWVRNFEALGQKRDELDVVYELVKLRRDYFMDRMSLEWWASVLLELPSRYGTRPFRPLKAALVIVLLFAVLYWLADPFHSPKGDALGKEPLIAFAVLYSLDTFVPFIDVAGVREWGWTVARGYHWVVVAERLLGLIMSLLAAYSLTRNFPLSRE